MPVKNIRFYIGISDHWHHLLPWHQQLTALMSTIPLHTSSGKSLKVLHTAMAWSAMKASDLLAFSQPSNRLIPSLHRLHWSAKSALHMGNHLGSCIYVSNKIRLRNSAEIFLVSTSAEFLILILLYYESWNQHILFNIIYVYTDVAHK